MEDDLAYYLARLHDQGVNAEGAYFALVEVDDSRLPELIEAFHAETSLDVKAILVEIIWEHRLHESLPFLFDTFKNPYPEIWKNALDGIVALRASEGRGYLESERQRILDEPQRDSTRLEWIDEALRQMQE